MSAASKNIDARIVEDGRLQKAREVVRMQRRLDAWASWQGSNKAYLRKQQKNRESVIEEELTQANRELKLARRENLKRLLEKDHAQFEKELNDKGLAIVRRDLV